MYPFLSFLVVGLGSPAATSRRSAAGFFLQCSFQFSFEKRRFRSISRTTDFGRLVPLPFGAEEGPRKGLFSDAPFGQFCLAAYLSGVLPSCLCGVRSFRRLGMHLSGPSDFAFCIDKALVHAPFKSQDNVFLSMYPFAFFLIYVPFCFLACACVFTRNSPAF